MNLSLLQRWQGGFQGLLVSSPQTLGQFSALERQALFQKVIAQLHLSTTIPPQDWQTWLGSQPSKITLLLHLFPLALFRHDYPQPLAETLNQFNKLGYLSPTDQGAIAQWFDLLTVIQRSPVSPLPVLTQLSDRLTPHEDSLSSPLAIGLRYFLETPGQFALSWQRAAHQSLETLFFTSSFSGLYNGWIGIPNPWQYAIASPNLAKSLYRQWLGALPQAIPDHCVTAIPNTMQYRPSLKLISFSEASVAETLVVQEGS